MYIIIFEVFQQEYNIAYNEHNIIMVVRTVYTQ